MQDRIERLKTVVREEGADAFVVSAPADVRWASGFTGSNALLIIRLNDHSVFITDGRYTEQAGREVAISDQRIAASDLTSFLVEERLLAGCARVLFQADATSYSKFSVLSSSDDVEEWIGREDLLTILRGRKDPDEVDAIRGAQKVTEAVFDEILGIIRPGITEHELASEIVYAHLSRGAERMSFDPIVAFGENSALPHARPTDRRLKAGEVILLDFGCVQSGYASDMTRTVVLGDAGPEFERVYNIVSDAQSAALDAAQADMPASDLDAAARCVIEEAGYGEHFTHSLGHGIGLETHEWPRVAKTSDAVLPEGCVITIEPGIYLPGQFGVRIEDIIVLREGGSENVTSTSQSLIRL
jgi:Xaa-Pro aminopeptidase